MKITVTTSSTSLPDLMGASKLLIAGEAKDNKTAYNIQIQNLHETIDIYIDAANGATITDSTRISSGGGIQQLNEVDMDDINLIADSAANNNIRLLIN